MRGPGGDPFSNPFFWREAFSQLIHSRTTPSPNSPERTDGTAEARTECEEQDGVRRPGGDPFSNHFFWRETLSQ